ncbi:hypothetical protein ABIF86_000414 [Bradyrhizobium japonicum]
MIDCIDPILHATGSARPSITLQDAPAHAIVDKNFWRHQKAFAGYDRGQSKVIVIISPTRLDIRFIALSHVEA